MEQIVLIVLFVLGIPIVLLLWLAVVAIRAARGVRDLDARLNDLALDVRQLRREVREHPASGPAAPTTSPTRTAGGPIDSAQGLRDAVPPVPAPSRTDGVEPVPPAAAPAKPPPPPVVRRAVEVPTHPSAPLAPISTPPPLRPPPPPRPVAHVPESPAPAPAGSGIDWEQFMGVKLFAWVGGFAFFLFLVFILKYSFEKQLISPEMQVGFEYLLCAGLLVGGLWLNRNYAVLGQTLAATAVVGLYAVTFAGHAYYHLLGVLPAFGVMVLVTAVAFLLAARLDAQVVAILGLLGGFLTPVLLSTGKDNPLGLFSYLALLDAGLIAVVVQKRWNYQLLLAAVGTVALQLAWVAKFFIAAKLAVALRVFLGFELLFLLAFYLADRDDPWVNTAAVGMAFVPLAFAFHLLGYREVGLQPWRIFGFVLAADLGVLALVLLRGQLAPAHVAAGLAAFLALAFWTSQFLSPALLLWGLGFYFIFAVLHAVFPVVLERVRPGAAPVWWGHVFPLLALLLVLLPVLRLPELSWLVWVCVLALDALGFVLAVLTSSLVAIAGALVLTLVVIGAWILNVPVLSFDLPALLIVVGGFALVFFGLGLFAARRIVPRLADVPTPDWWPKLPIDARAQLPACSAILPFLLLIMVVLRLPLGNPSPVFGLALLLVVLLLGVARWTNLGLLALVGLGCSAALEYAWHVQHFRSADTPAGMILAWYLGFAAVFTVFPFLFRKELEDQSLPWAAAALAGPAHFALVHRLVLAAWPNPVMGLLPAAFALPPLLGLLVLLRPVESRRLAQLAWFGGATLFFVTLIFPIQFERQWLTIAWAFEGAALLWLFHRVPHNGLRVVGVGLLCVAFGRLALNLNVLDYHPRSATPIWNWYLYTYGLVSLSLFAGAELVADRRGTALLNTLGTVLAFLLLNIEIADYFTAPGTQTLTFEFAANFARDMTYSIAWALFGLGLLVAGIARKLPAARYAALALLSVTLLKLFLHDLAHLNQLYRIGAFGGVAVILLVASFLYQRFIPATTEAQ